MQDTLTWTELVTKWNELPEPIRIFVIFIGYVVLLFLTLRISRRIINKYGNKMTPNTKASLQTFSRMIIILIFGVAFLNQFEQFAGSLIGLTALLGTAIGFASTQTIGNMISGIYIMISRPFFIADYVIFPKLNIEGIIEDISINYTKVILPNGTNAIIANKTVLSAEVINTRVEMINQDDAVSKEVQEVKDNLKTDLKNLFKKISDQKSIYYIYPIKFSVDVNMKQSLVNQAVQKLENFLENEVEGVKDMSWNVISRNRLEVTYEVSILVEKASLIFRVVSKALNNLEIFLEEVKG